MDTELGTLSGRKEALKADTTVLSISASSGGRRSVTGRWRIRRRGGGAD